MRDWFSLQSTPPAEDAQESLDDVDIRSDGSLVVIDRLPLHEADTASHDSSSAAHAVADSPGADSTAAATGTGSVEGDEADGASSDPASSSQHDALKATEDELEALRKSRYDSLLSEREDWAAELQKARQKLKALRREHESALSAERETSGQRLHAVREEAQALRDAHAQELQAERDASTAKLGAQERRQRASGTYAHFAMLDATHRSLRTAHHATTDNLESHIEASKRKHTADLAALKTKHDKELQKLDRNRRQRLVELESAHDTEIRALNSELAESNELGEQYKQERDYAILHDRLSNPAPVPGSYTGGRRMRDGSGRYVHSWDEHANSHGIFQDRPGDCLWCRNEDRG